MRYNIQTSEMVQKVASFDIDPQKCFTTLCPDELPVEGGKDIAPALNAQAEHAELRIVSRCAHPYEADWVANSADEFLAPVDQKNVDLKWFRHGVVGTKGFELLDGLPHPVEGYDFMVNKGLDHDAHPYGACYHDLANTKSTGVIEYLAYHKVTDVIVGGLATDYCVLNTALQLREAGFRVIFNEQASRGVAPETTAQAIITMRINGVAIANTASEILAFLSNIPTTLNNSDTNL